MEELLHVLLRFHSRELASERAAIRVVVRARWPHGVRCPTCRRPCSRQGVRLICTPRCRRATIFTGTPLAVLRKPRVRPLLLALRAFTTTARGLSARELARELGLPRMTMWRHMHLLRTLLPRAASVPTTQAAAVHVCHATARQPCAFVVVGARNTLRGSTARPAHPGHWPRLIGETVRTWLNGTHHGVTTRWLPLYVREAGARLSYPADDVLRRVLDLIAFAP